MFYRSEYINHDFNKVRFFWLVFFFIISILLIILSPNIIRILIGWDGLGLISYCLVIYYQRFSRYNSGILTVLINRIGDVFILISLGILIIIGSWNFVNFNNLIWIILLIVILASFTKRAQIPFSSWLPAAMAAPTPVSSLVHSSTLVTAGVYLIIRFHYLINKIDFILFYILVTGLLTIVFAGLSANFEFDLKKIIAYSTLSQLGLIIIIIGIKNYELSYFHLIIHAIFKSIIFICSGVMIHSMLNYQDIRFIGFLYKFIPLTSIIFVVSNLSLCGIPFFSGFFSKDQILEYIIFNKLNLICYILIIFGTGLTVSYRVRLSIYLINFSFNFFPLRNLIDNKIINFPILILLLMRVIFGYFINWMLFIIIEEIFIQIFEKILILLICFIFIRVGKFIYKGKYKFNYFIRYFLGKIWFLYILNSLFLKYFLLVGIFFIKVIDKGIREWILKNSIIKISENLNNKFIYLNFNYFINLLLLISYFILIIILLI